MAGRTKWIDMDCPGAIIIPTSVAIVVGDFEDPSLHTVLPDAIRNGAAVKPPCKVLFSNDTTDTSADTWVHKKHIETAPRAAFALRPLSSRSAAVLMTCAPCKKTKGASFA